MYAAETKPGAYSPNYGYTVNLPIGHFREPNHSTLYSFERATQDERRKKVNYLAMGVTLTNCIRHFFLFGLVLGKLR